MTAFLFAGPWWVNLLIFIPFFTYYGFRKKKLDLSRKQLLAVFIFGGAFGFVEASVVVYLRASLGMLSPDIPSAQAFAGLPASLFLIEFFREAATMIMLLAVAFLAARTVRERWAVFLWAFATWDLFYYVFLWLTIRWPTTLTTPDVLFLIPTPWYAQVWFPVLVDVLVMMAIIGTN
jgi:hypothetical protein